MKNEEDLNNNKIINFIMEREEGLYKLTLFILIIIGTYYLYRGNINMAFIILGIVFLLALSKKQLID